MRICCDPFVIPQLILAVFVYFPRSYKNNTFDCTNEYFNDNGNIHDDDGAIIAIAIMMFS